MRGLHEIATDLEALAESGDLEDAHLRADDLLLEAIEYLVPGWARITVAFRRIPKWYA